MLPSKQRDMQVYGPEVDNAPPPCRHNNPKVLKVYTLSTMETPGRKDRVWRTFECRKCHKRAVQYFGATAIDWPGEFTRRHERVEE